MQIMYLNNFWSIRVSIFNDLKDESGLEENVENSGASSHLCDEKWQQPMMTTPTSKEQTTVISMTLNNYA